VALLDYGQAKEMPEDLRLAYANLVVAMADDDFVRAEESFRYTQFYDMLCVL
jgi:aarF domain-containing kinase